MIRAFNTNDAVEVNALIAHTLRTSNIRDYSSEYIEDVIAHLTPEDIKKRARWMHIYVACEDGRIVGVAGIGPFWGKSDESSVFNFFVDPAHQGKGIGKAILNTLESDEFALRAKRIEIAASITAVEFYKKLGYTYKDGIDEIDDEGLYRLEKHRN